MSEFIVTPTRILRRDSIAIAEHLAENGGTSRVHFTTTGGHKFSVADPDGAIWRSLLPMPDITKATKPPPSDYAAPPVAPPVVVRKASDTPKKS